VLPQLARAMRNIVAKAFEVQDGAGTGVPPVEAFVRVAGDSVAPRGEDGRSGGGGAPG
jgi:hypothetical protein